MRALYKYSNQSVTSGILYVFGYLKWSCHLRTLQETRRLQCPYQGALYFLPRLKMTDTDIPLVPRIALQTGNWFLQINTVARTLPLTAVSSVLSRTSPTTEIGAYSMWLAVFS